MTKRWVGCSERVRSRGDVVDSHHRRGDSVSGEPERCPRPGATSPGQLENASIVGHEGSRRSRNDGVAVVTARLRPRTLGSSMSFYVPVALRFTPAHSELVTRASQFGDAVTLAGRGGPTLARRLRDQGLELETPLLFDAMGYKEGATRKGRKSSSHRSG